MWFIMVLLILLPFRLEPSIEPNLNQASSDLSGLVYEEIFSSSRSVASQPPVFSWDDLIRDVWLVGTLLGLAAYGFLYRRQAAYVKGCKPLYGLQDEVQGLLRDLGIKRRVHLVQADRDTSPYVFGIFKARLVLPPEFENQLSSKDRLHVYRHEIMHVSHFDLLIKNLFALVVIFQWFNPLVWIGYGLFNRDIEMACDYRVIRAMTAQERASYGYTLLDYACYQQANRGLIFSQAFINKKLIKRRIEMVVKYKRSLKKASLSGLLAGGLAGLILCLTPSLALAQGQQENPGSGLTDMTDYSLAYVAEDQAQDPVETESLHDPIEHYRVTSAYGYREWTQSFHKGMDIPAPTGTPVYAIAKGRVVYIDINEGFGKVIGIEYDNGMKTVYAHLDSIGVDLYQSLEPGQEVGQVGQTGRSTGPHLHFELFVGDERVNPQDYFSAYK